MQLAADARVVATLLRGMGGAGTHAERLQRFYAPQAAGYDCFRERLLHGRDDLIGRLPVVRGARIVELGGGTGQNLERFGARLERVERAEIVDLCPALLAVARARHAGRPNVCIVEADATTWRPAVPVDCVYFSYALTMIPDWRAAIDNAVAMLKPGGTLGVVDFYVSRARHGALARALWQRWFRHDGVRLSPDHLPYLRDRLQTIECLERRGAVPYLPGLAAPYYVFVGCRAGP